MALTLTKAEPTNGRPTWIVADGDHFLGEVTHVAPFHWSAEAMDGTHFRARSRREAVLRLRIHAVGPMKVAC